VTRPNHPPIVYIEWRDAASAAGSWTDRETAVKDALHYSTDPIVGAGFLLAEAKDTVVVGLILNHHNDDAGHVMAIPRGMVTRMTVLRKARGWDAVEAKA
jgi:hypothetical protein